MEATLRKIFNKNSLKSVSQEKVDHMAEKYPYFAPLQYFRAIKSRLAEDGKYESHAAAASIYFNNPLWFGEQLKGWESLIGESHIEEATEDDKNEPILDLSQRSQTSQFANLKISHPSTQPDSLKDEFPVFQAFHTVDYFASQGIKISADMLQTDTFGRQLRSFTEWLRTMKRIPAAADANKQETLADPRVARFAESSLREGEVLTEAMAEVLAKQGKTAGAIDIYHKLSLLNPHKSAYFASLIETLKGV